LDNFIVILIYQMNKKLILIIIIVLAIELSGHGILSSIYKLMN